MKWLFTELRFIKQEEYVLSDEEHIFRKLRVMIKNVRKKFDMCDSKKYSHKKVDLDRFQYIEQVLQEEEAFSLKN